MFANNKQFLVRIDLNIAIDKHRGTVLLVDDSRDGRRSHGSVELKGVDFETDIEIVGLNRVISHKSNVQDLLVVLLLLFQPGHGTDVLGQLGFDTILRLVSDFT
jgi:hypothetical protein